MTDAVIEVTKGHGNHRIITTDQLKRVMAVIEAAEAIVGKDGIPESDFIRLETALAALVSTVPKQSSSESG